MTEKIKLLENSILENKMKIIKILETYESFSVANEEIDLSINALRNCKYIKATNAKLSVFLPMNLPFFSLVTYVLIPSCNCQKTYYRPSSITAELSKKISDCLRLEKYNVYIVEESRNIFLEKYAQKSNIVIFVGSSKTSKTILKSLNKDILFLNFGNGLNSIVGFEDANRKLLIDKIIRSITFNNGQDCGKPSLIFLDKKISDNIIKKVLKCLGKPKLYITRDEDLNNIILFIQKNKKNMLKDVYFNICKNEIEPIVLKQPIENFILQKEELYGPVFNFIIFNEKKELINFFKQRENKDKILYVSKFGNQYFDFCDNLVLKNKTILDIDNGYMEFGNYNNYSSYLSYKGIKITKPLLVNREIEYFYNNSLFSNINIKSKNNKKNIFITIQSILKKEIQRIFKGNLIYSFIFGSAVKNKKYKYNDIDIFICTYENNKEQIIEFKNLYYNLHYKYGLKPDVNYPGEIITLENLQILLSKEIVIKDLKVNSEIFDYIFYNQILNDQKVNLYGEFSDLNIKEEIINNNCKKICENINNQIDYNKVRERIFNKSLFALSNNDIMFFSNFLVYPKIDNKENLNILKKIDDGLLLIYELGGNNELN